MQKPKELQQQNAISGENEHLLSDYSKQQVIRREPKQTLESQNDIAEEQANKLRETALDNIKANYSSALPSHCIRDNKQLPLPEKMLHQNNEQNGSTIILTPTVLNETSAAKCADGVGSAGAGGENNANKLMPSARCDYKGPKCWQHLVSHWSIISQPLALLAIFLALWALAYILLPQYAMPDTGIMRIMLLFVGAQILGILVTFAHLPDMLGMLGFGVLYTNVGLANFSGYERFEAILREMALINIMLLAGLGLDANAFKKLWLMILRLTMIPTIAEVFVIALLAKLLLDMPWVWGILLGLVVTAVSPNVVVTVMLTLKEERLGLNDGIHTLIYAMTACNDVVAIFLFGVLCGGIFSTGSLSEQILQGPIGIGMGIVYGYIYGMALHFLPSGSATYANALRFTLTVLGGTISVLGSKAIGYQSAGALGCVMLAFIATMGWKRQEAHLTRDQLKANELGSVSKRLDLLWKFLKPVSFSLIGKEIHFAKLDGNVVMYGALLIIVGSLFRLLFAYISTYGGNLSTKERAYITISGFPKATVQAALGPNALDTAKAVNASSQSFLYANNVLVISVLAIIFTAPLGAILMLRLAPHWLQRSRGSVSDGNDNNAYTVSNTASGVRITVGGGSGGGGDGNGDGAEMMNSPKFAQNLSLRSNKSQNTVDVASSSVDQHQLDDTPPKRPPRHLV